MENKYNEHEQKMLKRYGLTYKDIERVIIHAHITESGNVYVEGIMGGGVEMNNKGQYIHDPFKAKCNYTKRYFKYLGDYLK